MAQCGRQENLSKKDLSRELRNEMNTLKRGKVVARETGCSSGSLGSARADTIFSACPLS
jgi:hypothetical protein